jgi:c-di-GMP-binding flagellar brake protein YcgR
MFKFLVSYEYRKHINNRIVIIIADDVKVHVTNQWWRTFISKLVEVQEERLNN